MYFHYGGCYAVIAKKKEILWLKNKEKKRGFISDREKVRDKDNYCAGDDTEGFSFFTYSCWRNEVLHFSLGKV